MALSLKQEAGGMDYISFRSKFQSQQQRQTLNCRHQPLDSRLLMPQDHTGDPAPPTGHWASCALGPTGSTYEREIYTWDRKLRGTVV